MLRLQNHLARLALNQLRLASRVCVCRTTCGFNSGCIIVHRQPVIRPRQEFSLRRSPHIGIISLEVSLWPLHNREVVTLIHCIALVRDDRLQAVLEREVSIRLVSCKIQRLSQVDGRPQFIPHCVDNEQLYLQNARGAFNLNGSGMLKVSTTMTCPGYDLSEVAFNGIYNGVDPSTQNCERQVGIKTQSLADPVSAPTAGICLHEIDVKKRFLLSFPGIWRCAEVPKSSGCMNVVCQSVFLRSSVKGPWCYEIGSE